jgi:hypothetical protein
MFLKFHYIELTDPIFFLFQNHNLSDLNYFNIHSYLYIKKNDCLLNHNVSKIEDKT